MVRNAHDNTLPDLSLHIDPDHATINYTQSLENNLAEGQEEAAKAASNQAVLAIRQLHDQIRSDVTNAVRNLQQLSSNWAALNDAERQMEIIVDSNKHRAEFGAIGWQDYGSSLSQLLGLQQQVVTAQMQFAVGLGALRLATGSIEMDTETPANIALKIASLPAN
jgi:outer membrane protein TolC